jgi:hypothetical protein
MTATTEVLAVGEQTLAELAATINHEHHAGSQRLAQTLEHWVRAGEALLTARDRCSLGDWKAWLATNVDVSYTHACAYMRVARYADTLRELDEPVTSVQGAVALIRQLPRATSPLEGSRTLTKDQVEEAKELRAAGLAWGAIAELLGFRYADHKTVQYALDPNARQRARASSKRLRDAHAALQQQRREQEFKRAVRRAGAATAEAWSMAERMQDVLAQAQRETNDRDARRALSEASVHYRKMRDEIVRALGVS